MVFSDLVFIMVKQQTDPKLIITNILLLDYRILLNLKMGRSLKQVFKLTKANMLFNQKRQALLPILILNILMKELQHP